MECMNKLQKKPKLVSIAMVGAFPPPMHGMSAVNAAVRDRLIATGAGVLVLDVAAPSLDRGLLQRLCRLPRFLQGLIRLALLRGIEGKPLYMSVSGGFGQVYELFFLVVARVKHMRVVLHHHSFAYLDQPSRLTNTLTRFAGASALHIVLSQGMGRRLTARYSVASQVMVLSNSALLLDGCVDKPRGSKRAALGVIGFLSNLSAEKGVFEFLDVCRAAQRTDLSLQAKLAGPFQDVETERRVCTLLKELTNVEYLGPLHGEAKIGFYQAIDVLLFPTRNDAEPLVVLEAMREGVPVIAYGRGAIPERVNERCGYVVPVGGNFVDEARSVLRKWQANPALWQATSQFARQAFLDLLAEGLASWVRLINILQTSKGTMSVVETMSVVRPPPLIQDLSLFRMPPNFRGRSGWYVQLWWLVQASLFAWSPQVFYGWRRFLLRCFGAKIGKGVIIRPTAHITYPWKVSIGENAWIGDEVVLYSLGEIDIGANTVVSQRSYLCTGSHDYRKATFDIFAKPIRIGEQVWIATDVFVAPGVEVGARTVVGARSSVFGNLPAGVIARGTPAIVCGRRDETVNGSP